MEGHLERAINALDNQFGNGVGKALLPPDKVIVINKVSALDAMYEIIVDGLIVGRLRFDIPKRGYTFILSLEGARRIGTVSRQKWVSLHDGVLKYLKDGANLMVPGVQGCDSDIKVDDEVWVTNSEGQVVAAGISKMTGAEMAKEPKGFAVKIRAVADPIDFSENNKKATWEDAVQANATDLEKIEAEAASFVKRTIAKQDDLPVVVAFSGGKDSLATYLVVESTRRESPNLLHGYWNRTP
jgi:phosphoadenosine phosphosulfate reductase